METAIDSNHGKPASRVLTVEDDSDVADSFKLLLELIGIEVRTAGDGPAALDAARQFHPDVAFIDIDLPGMNGYEVAQRLRQEHGSGLRLFALTGFGQESVKERALKAGFDRHLIKPITLDALKELLETPA